LIEAKKKAGTSATLLAQQVISAHHRPHSYKVIMRKLMTNLQLHVPPHEKRRKSNGECQSSGYQDNTALICCSYDGNRSRLAWQQSRRVRIHDDEKKAEVKSVLQRV